MGYLTCIGHCSELSRARRFPVTSPDAFGLMAIAYEEPSRLANFNREIKFVELGLV
jgi:hypothetical protein